MTLKCTPRAERFSELEFADGLTSPAAPDALRDELEAGGFLQAQPVSAWGLNMWTLTDKGRRALDMLGRAP